MEMKEITGMDGAAINKKIADLRLELFNLKFQKHTSGIQKPNDLKVIKKSIARLNTALNQKGKSE